MNKRIFLTEEQIKIIINEELGIAKEVNNLSRIIETKICKLIEEKKYNEEFKINDLNICFHFYNFSSIEEMQEWYYSKTDKVTDGYSFKNKTLYVNVYAINGKYDINYLFDTIQHEVEHYWQTKNAKKSFLNKSELLTDLLSCGNPITEIIARIIYLSKKYEIDAYVNGSYSVLCKENFDNFEEYINNTNLKDIITILKDNQNAVKNWNFNSPLTLQGIRMCEKNGIISCNITREKLLSIIKNTYNYLIKKAAKAWALYKTKNTTILNKEEIFEKIITDKIFGKFLL